LGNREGQLLIFAETGDRPKDFTGKPTNQALFGIESKRDRFCDRPAAIEPTRTVECLEDSATAANRAPQIPLLGRVFACDFPGCSFSSDGIPDCRVAFQFGAAGVTSPMELIAVYFAAYRFLGRGFLDFDCS
jgi:hypothetical protein